VPRDNATGGGDILGSREPVNNKLDSTVASTSRGSGEPRAGRGSGGEEEPRRERGAASYTTARRHGERKCGTLARRGRGSARASPPESSEAVSICSCRDLQLDFWSTEPVGRYGPRRWRRVLLLEYRIEQRGGRKRKREREEITGETAGASH